MSNSIPFSKLLKNYVLYFNIDLETPFSPPVTPGGTLLGFTPGTPNGSIPHGRPGMNTLKCSTTFFMFADYFDLYEAIFFVNGVSQKPQGRKVKDMSTYIGL